MINVIVLENCDYLNILRDINLKIRKSTINAIIGPPASGKTTLLRLINRECDNVNISLINQVTLNNQYYNEVVVLDTNLLLKYNFLEEDIKLNNLSIEHKIIIHILKNIDNGTDVLLVDDLFIYISKKNKEKLFNVIKDKKITLIFSTTNEEELRYASKIIVMNNNTIIRTDTLKSLIKNEIEYKNLGFSLPFIIDLNAQLISYELINKEYDEESLIGEVWK